MENYKIISISSQNQITIPKSFLEELGFGNKAECRISGGEILIRPFRDAGETFSEEILQDLIEEGYSGETLLKKFKERRRQVPEAIHQLIEDAKKEAVPISEEELFGDV